MCECFAYYVCVSRVCSVPMKVRQGITSPGSEVEDYCEPPYGCWEPNVSPLQELPVLLTSELSIFPAPKISYFYFKIKLNI